MLPRWVSQQRGLCVTMSRECRQGGYIPGRTGQKGWPLVPLLSGTHSTGNSVSSECFCWNGREGLSHLPSGLQVRLRSLSRLMEPPNLCEIEKKITDQIGLVNMQLSRNPGTGRGGDCPAHHTAGHADNGSILVLQGLYQTALPLVKTSWSQLSAKPAVVTQRVCKRVGHPGTPVRVTWQCLR